MQKSVKFGIRIMNLSKYLDLKKSFAISNQIIRSGTSIGANLSEAYCGASKKDFLAKVQISLKECAETEYWLMLLKESETISEKEFNSINKDCEEIKKLLVSTIKTTKNS
jgi:four helix bundle protein